MLGSDGKLVQWNSEINHLARGTQKGGEAEWRTFGVTLSRAPSVVSHSARCPSSDAVYTYSGGKTFIKYYWWMKIDRLL